MTDDADALRELTAASKPGAKHTLVHYLYLPDRRLAAGVIEQLRRHGFQTEDRLGADRVNWLVLARQDVVPTEESVAETRQLMERLAAEVDGEYDGWEAEVQADKRDERQP